MNHPSEHVLDRLASGLGPVPAEHAHVAACPRCTERLAALRVDVAEARSLPGYAPGLAAVRRVAPRPTRGFSRWMVAAVAALAFAGAVVLSLRPTELQPDVRTKGQATLSLAAADGQPVGPSLVPGQAVHLALNSAGLPFGLVVMIDASKKVTVLWPAGASTSGRVADAVSVRPGFRITPGDFVLNAVYSSYALPAAPLLAAFEAAAARCSGAVSASCLSEIAVPADAHRALAFFRVGASP